jgi:tRNA(Leu) C34 or U34 (ribose-2'-O)-methylase TrmL
MLTVVAHKDVKWGAPKLDQCQWEEVCGSFEVQLQMVDSEADYDFSDWAQRGPVIVFDEHGDIPLAEFRHLQDGTYVFGRSGQDVLAHTPRDASVKIVRPNSTRTLFGVSAAAIVLYERSQQL